MNSRSLHYSFILTLILFLSSCAKDIVDLTGSISGVVKGTETNDPIEGCIVSITPANTSTSTSASGTYDFQDLEVGTYTLNFDKDGFEAKSQSVTVVAGDNKICNIFLDQKDEGIEVTPTSLNFGDMESVKELFIKRKSNYKSTISYVVKSDADYIMVSPNSGSISNEQQTIKVTIDRSKLSIGDYSKKITITTANGSVEIPILFQQVISSEPKVNNSGDFYDITETSFKVDGVIVSLGGNQVTNHGHCWATTEMPTIAEHCTKLGSTKEVGEFTSLISEGIKAGETYYVRAYATNSKGTAYSDQMVITIPKTTAPVVKTLEATNITKSTSTINGEIVNDGGSSITECGFYYGTTENPSTKKALSSTTATQLKLALTALKDGTTYYYKVYAKNSKGETCGEIRSFTTLPEYLPTVQTVGATKITTNSALLHGKIIDKGTSDVTECGFYFGTSESTTNKRKAGTSIEDITYALDNLAEGTTYYFRVYAVNKKGEIKGDICTFKTSTNQTSFDIEDYDNDENYQ